MPTTTRADRARFAAQMAEITERIGGRIKQLREERKADDPRWTQDFLARQLSGHRTGSEVSRWERGEVKPREETLEEIARVLRVDVADLYSGPVEPPESPLDALRPVSQSELDDRLEWIESALQALLAERGLEHDAPPSEQDRPPQTGSSPGGPRND